MTDKAGKIEKALTQGVEQIIPGKEKLRKIMSKQKIRLYLGIDPTAPNIHLGHVIPLKKLREFQDLGHETILLFGTFTAQIGDPSERDEKRKPLTLSQVKKNMATYQKQAAKILNLSKVKVKYNTDWLSKLKFGDLAKLASYFTTSRLLERDMFRRRLRKGGEVWLNELLYPLMQGYDSVAMNVDLEIGSTDQTFNMLIGRKLQRIYNKKEKFILTTPMLTGLDGGEMSKTYGNVVNIDDQPSDMYGKIMSLKDNLIAHYFKLCTDVEKIEIKRIKKSLKERKINPRDIKAKLAKEIVKIYHGKEKAQKAEQEFNRVFREKKLPSKIKRVVIKRKKINILELLTKTKLVSSKSQAKRLVLQKAVEIDGEIKGNWHEIISMKKGMTIKIGKRRFVKIS